jgi:hypothetical protein
MINIIILSLIPNCFSCSSVDVDLIEALTLKLMNISRLGVYTEYKEVENIPPQIFDCRF